MEEGVGEVEVLRRNGSVLASGFLHLGGVPGRHDRAGELDEPLGPLALGRSWML